jgi:hypothetical protein
MWGASELFSISSNFNGLAQVHEAVRCFSQYFLFGGWPMAKSQAEQLAEICCFPGELCLCPVRSWVTPSYRKPPFRVHGIIS